jgi:hypothetical protein
MAKKLEKEIEKIEESKEKKSKIEIKEKKKEIIIKEVKRFPEIDFSDKKQKTKKKSLEEIEEGMHSEIEQTSTEKFSPVLEKIANAPKIINLERGISRIEPLNNFSEKEERDFNYTSKAGAEKINYIQSMEHAEMPRKIEPLEFKKNVDDFKKISFAESSELKLVENANYERYTPVKVKELQEEMRNQKDRALRRTMKYETSR